MKNRENRLVRARSRIKAKSTFGTGESQPSPDDQLSRLEDDIRRLKIEFDIYFNGAAKRPPYDTKGRVETHLKRLGDDRTLSFAQRYRYNSLAARYTAFRDLWRRIMQGREEGRDPVSTARVTAKEEAAVAFTRTSMICADAHKDLETVKRLYNVLVEAKESCGESTADFSFPRFHRLIASQADTIKQKLNCDRVRFTVDVERGHVSFRAKAAREEE